MPSNAKCLPGSVYNAEDESCKQKTCKSGFSFGLDVGNKKPCCIQCEDKQTLCLKPLLHSVGSLSGSQLKLDALCRHVRVMSGINCTIKDDCITINGKEAWYGCKKKPQWLNSTTGAPIAKPDDCWWEPVDTSDLVSSGLRLKLGIVAIGVNLLLFLSL